MVNSFLPLKRKWDISFSSWNENARCFLITKWRTLQNSWVGISESERGVVGRKMRWNLPFTPIHDKETFFSSKLIINPNTFTFTSVITSQDRGKPSKKEVSLPPANLGKKRQELKQGKGERGRLIAQHQHPTKIKGKEWNKNKNNITAGAKTKLLPREASFAKGESKTQTLTYWSGEMKPGRISPFF